jgi:dihydrofolate reductase
MFASLASSLDGYIASPNGDLSWLNDAMRGDEDYGFGETMARTGAYIMGANTFRATAAMGGGGGSKRPPTYVVTHAPPEQAPDGVTFHSGPLPPLVAQAKAEVPAGKDVHVFGGGDVVTQLIAADALDELTLALVPVLLGGGVRLFGDLGAWTRLRLRDCRSFDSGIVLLRYERSS